MPGVHTFSDCIDMIGNLGPLEVPHPLPRDLRVNQLPPEFPIFGRLVTDSHQLERLTGGITIVTLTADNLLVVSSRYEGGYDSDYFLTTHRSHLGFLQTRSHATPKIVFAGEIQKNLGKIVAISREHSKAAKRIYFMAPLNFI